MGKEQEHLSWKGGENTVNKGHLTPAWGWGKKEAEASLQLGATRGGSTQGRGYTGGRERSMSQVLGDLLNPKEVER